MSKSDPIQKPSGQRIKVGDMSGGSIIKTPPKPTETGQTKPDTK
jgi:hypothetical protein